jgi:hypothetical protein
MDGFSPVSVDPRAENINQRSIEQYADYPHIQKSHNAKHQYHGVQQQDHKGHAERKTKCHTLIA